MIDMIYLAHADDISKKQIPTPTQKITAASEQSGMIHSKVAGRYEIVKNLPKEADTFDNMFDYADAFGKLRLAYINSANKINTPPSKNTKSATVFGGEFGFDTAKLNGFQAHAAAYVSQGADFVNPDDNDLHEDFFAKDLNSFAYIAEASINYSNDVFEAKIGRVRVDTPFAQSDDIRMAPNTFEGAWANIDYSTKLSTQFLYFKRWAGYDSQDSGAGAYQDEFKDLVSSESFGMIGASATYKYAKNSEASLWYYNIDKMSSIAYGEMAGVYYVDGDDIHLEYGIQDAHIKELNNSNVDGNVFGAMSIFHYNGAFFGGAYNIAISNNGKYVTNGFGGGPYYTSMNESTISALSEEGSTNVSGSNNNTESFRIGAGYEFERVSINGLVLEVAYGEFYGGNGRITEKDAILTYDITDRWYLEGTYTNYKSTSDDSSFDRALVRLEYKF